MVVTENKPRLWVALAFWTDPRHNQIRSHREALAGLICRDSCALIGSCSIFARSCDHACTPGSPARACRLASAIVPLPAAVLPRLLFWAASLTCWRSLQLLLVAWQVQQKLDSKLVKGQYKKTTDNVGTDNVLSNVGAPANGRQTPPRATDNTQTTIIFPPSPLAAYLLVSRRPPPPMAAGRTRTSSGPPGAPSPPRSAHCPARSRGRAIAMPAMSG